MGIYTLPLDYYRLHLGAWKHLSTKTRIYPSFQEHMHAMTTLPCLSLFHLPELLDLESDTRNHLVSRQEMFTLS